EVGDIRQRPGATFSRPDLRLKIINHVVRNTWRDAFEVCRRTHLRHEVVLNVGCALLHHRSDVRAHPRRHIRQISGKLTGTNNLNTDPVSHEPQPFDLPAPDPGATDLWAGFFLALRAGVATSRVLPVNLLRTFIINTSLVVFA